MQLHGLLHEPQADAQAVLGARGRVGLREQVEHVRQRRGRDAHAVVGDLDARPSRLGPGLHADEPARGRVLARIVDEVAHHLRQAREVGERQPCWVLWGLPA